LLSAAAPMAGADCLLEANLASNEDVLVEVVGVEAASSSSSSLTSLAAASLESWEGRFTKIDNGSKNHINVDYKRIGQKPK
jgi:hypothetical protein